MRILIAVLLLLASTGMVLSADMIGKASVIDGDTLEIHGTRIRLWGIDAPESTQLCRVDDIRSMITPGRSAHHCSYIVVPMRCWRSHS